MHLVQIYVLDSDYSHLLDIRKPAFGDDVADKFPTITEDAEEAGKCLALRRPTACVLHLMRAMEAAVQTVCATLKIERLTEHGVSFCRIWEKIEAMPSGPDRDAWSEAHANLYHVKQAWRNNMMHPNRTYTQEQAVDIYFTVKAFARHLVGLL